MKVKFSESKKLLTALMFVCCFATCSLNAAVLKQNANVADRADEIRLAHLQKRHDLRVKTATCSKKPSSYMVSCNAIECPTPCATKYKSISCQSSKCDPTVELITQCHFEKKGTNGIILNKPGIYRLAEDIVFHPTKEGTQAIAITSEDVTLDLGPFKLSQGNSVENVYGVAVCRDVSCVKITGVDKEAKIIDFTLVGIRVLGRTDTITVENVTVAQSTPVQLINNELPESCTDLICFGLNAGIVVGEGDSIGLFMKGTSKENTVKNITLRNVTQRGSVLGCQIVMAFHVEVLDSYFTENTWVGLVGGITGFIPGDFFGIEFPVASDGLIRNCHIDSNVGDNGGLDRADEFFSGFSCALALNEVRGFTIENSTFNDNANTAAQVAADHDGCHDLRWKNCEFFRNRSTSFLSDGLHFSGSIPRFNAFCAGVSEDIPTFQCVNISIDNCVSADNGGGGQAIGFVFIFVNGACVTNCCAEAQSGTFNTAGFAVLGILDDFGRSENVTFDNCIATRNGNDEGSAGGAAGFAIRKTASNVILRNCTANANGNAEALDRYAAGFLIMPFISPPRPGGPTFNIMLDNCIANSNGNDIENAGGIVVRLLENEPPISNVSVQNTSCAYNAGFGMVFDDVPGIVINNCNVYQNNDTGIDVSAVTSAVLAMKNVAYANGAGGVSNYAGIPGANIVVTPSSSLPVPPFPGILNLDILPV